MRRTRHWAVGHPCPTAGCGRSLCRLLASGGRKRGCRARRRGKEPVAAGPISIQGSECANAGQTPILLTHKTPGLAASPGSCPSPSQAAAPPLLPPNSPLALCSLQESPSRPPCTVPSAEQPRPPAPKETWGKMSGTAGVGGHTRQEDSLIRASPRGRLLAPRQEVLPELEKRAREGSQEGPSGAGGGGGGKAESEAPGMREDRGERPETKGRRGRGPGGGLQAAGAGGAPTGRPRWLGRAPVPAGPEDSVPCRAPVPVRASVPEPVREAQRRRTLGWGAPGLPG